MPANHVNQMKYYIDGKLNKSNICEDKPYVEIINSKQYFEEYKSFRHKLKLFDADDKIRHSKIYIMSEYFYGTFQKPQRGDLEDKVWFFYADNERLTFVDDSDMASSLVEELEQNPDMNVKTPAQVLFMFLNALADKEGEYMDAFEDELNEFEAELMDKKNTPHESFDHGLHICRHELMRLKRYYKQLSDICQMLAECPYDIIDDECGRLFEYMSNRSLRLNEDAKELQEYAVQLREMYDSDISNRQNRIMKILTIVTTIFMPLTLLTGWYGMNFRYMPELYYKYSYFVVMGLALSVLITELIIFTKNKWLD